jgi:predicted transcriptional regulator
MSRSATARDYMTARLITLTPGMEIQRAINLLLKHRISGAPVLDDEGRLVGILSKKDCLNVAFHASYHKEWGGPVSDYMSREVETVDAETDIIQVVERFLAGPYRRFPVMSNNQVVGQISRHDVLKALADLW